MFEDSGGSVWFHGRRSKSYYFTSDVNRILMRLPYGRPVFDCK